MATGNKNIELFFGAGQALLDSFSSIIVMQSLLGLVVASPVCRFLELEASML